MSAARRGTGRTGRTGRRAKAEVSTAAAPARSTAFLEAAQEIGRALCAAAYWDDDGQICNWLGRADREGFAPGTITPATGALSADLYRGSAGVALFLAELAAVSGDGEARRTAVGGLRRSVRRLLAGPLERASPLSFFLGHLGAAWVAQRLLETAPASPPSAEMDGLDEDLDRLLAAVRLALAEPHPLDLLGGNSGAIPVLLHLARAGRDGCLELARECGRELQQHAERQGAYVTWHGETVAGPASGGTPPAASSSSPSPPSPPASSPPRPSPPSPPSPLLTGLSHGASGLALALLELYGATGEAALRDLARGACAYEDTFWSPPDGNWRDPRPAVAAGGFQTAWCHGAPGIALARLRALSLDPELRDAHAATARMALQTTAAALEQLLAQPRRDATLCHGLAGLCEVLLIGGTLLDDPRYRDAAARAATELARRHAVAGDWPSGMPSGGPSPALMLGTAGIGHHLLRLHAPGRVPPVLLVAPPGPAS